MQNTAIHDSCAMDDRRIVRKVLNNNEGNMTEIWIDVELRHVADTQYEYGRASGGKIGFINFANVSPAFTNVNAGAR
jgi:adenylylsulfate kinase-like enzyme